jgi:imidazolonepropionase-like amidohydrolase
MTATVFSNARIFDGENAALLEGQHVFVAAGRIAEVSARPPVPGDGEIVDCGGKVLLPGLIDAHVHAYAISVNFYENVHAPSTLLGVWAALMFSRMIERGFTTVRDTGGGDWGLYEAIERGFVKSPRLYYCGQPLSQTGGHVDFRNPAFHYRDDEQVLACGCGRISQIAAVVDGVDQIRRVCRENFFRGASFIKFTGSGGVSSTGDKLNSIQFADEEVSAIVDECVRHGAYCTTHIHPDAALKRVVKLGVHCIEHGTLIEPDTARMVADANISIVPTLAVMHALTVEGKQLGLPAQSLAKLDEVKDQAVGRMQHMKDAGVRIGYGTDLLGATERYQCAEFTLRSPIFSPLEILKQATSNNAEIIGAKGQLGVIRAGAIADILVADADPTIDAKVLADDGRQLAVIMKGGEFFRNRLASPPGATTSP